MNPVPLPRATRPLDRSDFAGAQRSFIDATASSPDARKIKTPDGGWQRLALALVLWLSREPALKTDDLLTLTFVLQSLGDAQITRIDQACFLALTTHPEWRLAALAFLSPYRDTLARTWLTENPPYRKLAAVARAEYPSDVPAWLCLSRL